MATLGNPTSTIAVLQKYQFNFQKKYGQNFLIDSNILENIISAADVNQDDCVLEIGPGIGTMTQYLCENAREVVAVEMLREPAERFLADNINNMLKNNGREIVSNMIEGEVDGFLNKPVCNLLEGHDDQLKQAVNTVESIYRAIINDHLPKILDSIDTSKIVRERINEMDVNETEKLIFQVMDKELKAIVWLGALLGLVMGSINIII